MLLVVWAVIAVTGVMRFTVGASRSLWMDETWTAMIAAQPTLVDFVKQCFYDTNAPLYYVVAALAAKVLGFSDFALRLPAAIFGALAPVAAMFSKIPVRVKLTWSVLLACWIPGLWYAQDARCYTLLILMAVLNCGIFVECLEGATRRNFTRWAIVSSLMILTHYYAAPLVGLQFLVLLWRRRALSIMWPGIVAFVPAAASMAVSASKFLLFTHDDVSWLRLITPSGAYRLLGFLVGGELMLPIVTAWALLSLVVSLIVTVRGGATLLQRAPKALWIAAGLAVLCVVLAMIVGAFKPVVSARYLLAFVPGVLLGLSVVATDAFPPASRAPALLGAIFFAAALVWTQFTGEGVHALNIERASERLMANQPKRLVWYWDNPFMLSLVRSSGNYSSLEGVGGFFFARAGRPIPVDVVDPKPGEDPNLVILDRAKPAGSAIIWVYDLSVAGTAAKRYPPRLSTLDSSWICENTGRYAIHVVACHRR